MSPTDLCETVRSKLQGGVLPREECARTWAGPGSGKACVACDQPIPPEEVEFECERQRGEVFRYHRACFECWERERRR